MNAQTYTTTKTTLNILGLFVLLLTAALVPGEEAEMPPLENNIALPAKLSEHHIFEGKPSALKPAKNFQPYELATTLFTDHAEKQRLINVPKGTKLIAIGNGLPEFPEGTVLVKTFFYYRDKRDTAKGKHIIETRLMIKSGSQWSAGTYQWNAEQTEAYLVIKGTDTPVNWVDDAGNKRTIDYHIPKTKECATCHNSGGNFMPIGPKISNLNREVSRDGRNMNQLAYLQQVGFLNDIAPSNFNKMPNWRDKALPLEDRARAYLDVNCAHCHSREGYCSSSSLKLGFELDLESTKIANHASRIERFMTKKTMPMLGTTVVDEEGLELIKRYINTLK